MQQSEKRPVLAFKPTRRRVVPRGDMLQTVERYMTLHDFKPQTVKIALQNVRWLIDTYGLTVKLLTSETAENIKLDMKRRELAANTIRQRLYAFEYLSAAFGQDVRIKKPPRNKSLPVYLSIAEARKLLDAAENIRDRGILALGLYGGLRPGETAHLLPVDVDVRRRVVHVRETKNGQDRDVPLTRECADILDEWLKCRPVSNTPYLFMTQHDNQLDIQTINRMVRRTVKLAGIEKKISGHKLRHTAATAMLKLGIPITEVALMLGHKDLESTMGYLHANVDELRESVDKRFKY